jgi:RNA polymerase sigma factor (sigma-70 family)
LNISESEYKLYLRFAKKITGNKDSDELLHETIEKILLLPEMTRGKDAYIYVVMKNKFIDWQRKKTKRIDSLELHLSIEPSNLPELNHVFKVLKELESEGRKLHTDRFIQSNFAMTATELARRQGVTKQSISESCTFVKKEIKKRYKYDRINA